MSIHYSDDDDNTIIMATSEWRRNNFEMKTENPIVGSTMTTTDENGKIVWRCDKDLIWRPTLRSFSRSLDGTTWYRSEHGWRLATLDEVIESGGYYWLHSKMASDGSLIRYSYGVTNIFLDMIRYDGNLAGQYFFPIKSLSEIPSWDA